MHIVTLTFDDGFLKSSLKTAGIFEKFGLSASINIVATGHWKNFTPKDQWHVPMGSFDDWNDLQARGHEIMPHGYMHANKSKLKLAEAQQLILECLSIFSQQLNNFNPKEAVFNFPYNASTPELEAWLPSVVKAFRTAGGGVNRLPSPGQTKLTTCGFGPEKCEQHLDQELGPLPEIALIIGRIARDHHVRIIKQILAHHRHSQLHAVLEHAARLALEVRVKDRGQVHGDNLMLVARARHRPHFAVKILVPHLAELFAFEVFSNTEEIPCFN